LERRFTDEQISEIIRRAAELSAEPGADGWRRGSAVTESELRRIALEIGLPGDAVDAAIEQVGTVTASDTGGDLTYERTFERRIEGEVGGEAYSALVEHFVPEWGIGRGTSTIGNMHTYRSMVGINSCQVSVSQRAGRTTLKVSSHAWVSLVATFLPATILSILIVIAALNVETRTVSERAAPMAIALAAVWVAAIVGNMRLVRSSNRKVARLTEAAASDLADSASHLRHRLESAAAVERGELDRERIR
jgi:hypothetical protein